LVQTSFVDAKLKAAINDACDWSAAALNKDGALSLKCISLLNEASTEISNVNMYNIYGDCVTDMCAGADSTKIRSKVPVREEYSVSEGGMSRKLARIVPHGPDACIDSGKATGINHELLSCP